MGSRAFEMKTAIATLILAAIHVCGSACAQGPVVKGVSGAPLINPRVTGWDGENFTVEHEGGVSKVSWDRMPETLRNGIPKPVSPKPEEFPLGISFAESRLNAKSTLRALSGFRLTRDESDGLIFANARYSGFPCDLYCLFQNGQVCGMIFKFTRAPYGSPPPVSVLVGLITAKYGKPDEIGGKRVAFWKSTVGGVMFVSIDEEISGPSLTFGKRGAVADK
jgi:hypothetical protein